MKRRSTVSLGRMKPLPPRLRITHLRALIRLEPSGSARALQLAALLRDQLTDVAANENRAV
jgi:hypothetical protein